MKRFKFLVVFFSLSFLFFCLNTLAIGAQTWTSLEGSTASPPPTPAPPRLSLLRSNDIKLDFRINTPGFEEETRDHEGTLYKLLTLPGESYLGSVGKPQLPKLSRMIAIPSNCKIKDIQVSVTVSKFQELDGYLIWPVSKETVVGGVPTLEFYKDEEFYATDQFYPNLIVEVESVGMIRDQKMAWIRICPIQYNPVTSKVRIYEDLMVHVSYPQGTVIAPGNLGPLEGLTKISVINYQSPASTPNPTPGIVTYPTDLLSTANKADYLIITTNNLWNNRLTNGLDQFANFRATRNNWDVAVVKTTDIYSQFTGASEDIKIKNFITHVYNNWSSPHMSDNHVGYVLLIGDARSQRTNYYLPAHFYQVITGDNYIGYSSIPTDYLYSCINDDNNDGVIDDQDRKPDLMTGRLTVNSGTELSTIVNKIINYENAGVANWKKKVMLVCGFSGEADKLKGNSVRYELYPQIKRYINTQIFFSVTEEMYRQDAYGDQTKLLAFKQDFINAVNSGRGIVNVRSHGLWDRWSWAIKQDPLPPPGKYYDFDLNDIRGLNNNNMPCFVYSGACDTGMYDYSSGDCFAEVFLKQANKGAVAILAASRPSHTEPDNKADALLFKILSEGISNLGQAIFYMKLNLPAGLSERVCHDILMNLFGDPGLDMCGGVSSTLSDLAIQPEDINLEFMDTSVLIKATVHNIGFSQANNVLIRFYDGDPNAGGTLIGDTSISIPRFESVIAQMTWTNPPYEPRQIYVLVDPANTIPELNETNNQASRMIALGLPVTSGANVTSSPAIVDLDNDSRPEIVVGADDGKLYVWDNKGQPLAGWPKYLGGAIETSPTVADIDGDKDLEIFIGVGSKVYGFHHDDKNSDGNPDPVSGSWPVTLDGGIYDTLAIADINQDGAQEIIVGTGNGSVYALDSQGNNLPGWPVSTDNNKAITSSLAVADLDGNGYSEVIAADQTGKVYAWFYKDDYLSPPDGDNKADRLPGWPVSAGGRIVSSPAVGNVDGLADMEIVVGCDDSKVYVWRANGQILPTYWPANTDTTYWITSSPALADIDNDGKLEVFVGCKDGKVYGFDSDGSRLSNWPRLTDNSYEVDSSPSIADVDGNKGNGLEIIVGSHHWAYNVGKLHIFHTIGDPANDSSITCAGAVLSSPAVSDIDGDGKIEAVVGSFEKVHIFTFGGGQVVEPPDIQWQMFRSNSRRTGFNTRIGKGTIEYPTIQQAIDGALPQEELWLSEGVYCGNVSFNGKPVTLRSIDGPGNTVIKGSIYFNHFEGRNSAIKGVTITQGSGIWCEVSSPTIENCIIKENVRNWEGGVIHCNSNLSTISASPLIKGNTIIDNTFYDSWMPIGGAIACWYNSSPEIINNLIVNNEPLPGGTGNGGAIACYDYQPIGGTIPGPRPKIINNTISFNQTSGLTYKAPTGMGSLSENSTLWDWEDIIKNNIITNNTRYGVDANVGNKFTYNDVWSNSLGNYSSGSQTGINGNISVDPKFIDPINGDYHLQIGSPCVDKGDPADDYSQEPLPNGGRINQGNYGNTPEATVTPRRPYYPTCFVSGTPILLANGSLKPIEKIKVGDLVLAFDEKTGEFKKDKVKETFKHITDKYLIVNNHLKVTENHPVYSDGKWMEIGRLKLGDKLLNSKGKPEMITSIQEVNKNVSVYNLEVNPFHTYIAAGYVVHNKKAPPLRMEQ